MHLHNIIKAINLHKNNIAIILIILLLIPFLPNHTLDPWQLFNVRNMAMLLVTIAGIQLFSYISICIFGERLGLAVTGILGGFISSTAVFANLSRYNSFTNSVMALAVLAVLAMLIEFISIITLASIKLSLFIIKPLLIMILVSIFVVSLLFKYHKSSGPNLSVVKNPINLLSVFLTTTLLVCVMILITVAKSYFSPDAIIAIAFLSGLFEIHGVCLATALLFLENHLSIQTAGTVLYTALTASFCSKVFLLFTLTPWKFALQTSIILCGIFLSGAIIYVLT